MEFHRGETVICSASVTDGSGNPKDPSTSMKITITDFQNGFEVNDQAMTGGLPDSEGEYYYDYTLDVAALKGYYTVIYKATDGTRITIKEDRFEVV